MLDQKPYLSKRNIPGVGDVQVIHLQAQFAEERKESKLDNGVETFFGRMKVYLRNKLKLGPPNMNSLDEMNYYLFGKPFKNTDKKSERRRTVLIQQRQKLIEAIPCCKEIAKIFLEVCSSQEEKPKKQQETIDCCIELFGRIYGLYLEVLKNNYELEVKSCSLEKVHPQGILFLIYMPLGCSVKLVGDENSLPSFKYKITRSSERSKERARFNEQLSLVESGNQERQNMENVSTDQRYQSLEDEISLCLVNDQSVPFEDRSTRRMYPPNQSLSLANQSSSTIPKTRNQQTVTSNIGNYVINGKGRETNETQQYKWPINQNVSYNRGNSVQFSSLSEPPDSNEGNGDYLSLLRGEENYEEQKNLEQFPPSSFPNGYIGGGIGNLRTVNPIIEPQMQNNCVHGNQAQLQNATEQFQPQDVHGLNNEPRTQSILSNFLPVISTVIDRFFSKPIKFIKGTCNVCNLKQRITGLDAASWLYFSGRYKASCQRENCNGTVIVL